MTNKRGRKSLNPEDKQLYMKNKGVGTRRQIDLLAKFSKGVTLVNDKQRIDFVINYMKAAYVVIDNLKHMEDGN